MDVVSQAWDFLNDRTSRKKNLFFTFAAPNMGTPMGRSTSSPIPFIPGKDKFSPGVFGISLA
jgi:hypothetical protein